MLEQRKAEVGQASLSRITLGPYGSMKRVCVVFHSAAAVYPPSTTSDVPVTPDESSHAR